MRDGCQADGHDDDDLAASRWLFLFGKRSVMHSLFFDGGVWQCVKESIINPPEM